MFCVRRFHQGSTTWVYPSPSTESQMCNWRCRYTFLTAFTSEKIYVVAGPEFGEFEGAIMIMQKAVYGTKTAALRFHEALSVRLRRQGFTPSQAEPDFWWQKTKANGFEYIACYVDDIICFQNTLRKFWENSPVSIH